MLLLWPCECGQPVCDYRKSLLDSSKYAWITREFIERRPFTTSLTVCVCVFVWLCRYGVCVSPRILDICTFIIIDTLFFLPFRCWNEKVYSHFDSPRIISPQAQTKSQWFSDNCLKTRWILFHLSNSNEYRLNSFVRSFILFLPNHSVLIVQFFDAERFVDLRNEFEFFGSSWFDCVCEDVDIRRLVRGGVLTKRKVL